MEKWDALLLTAQEGIGRQYDKDELDRDLDTLEQRLETITRQVFEGGVT
jgi:hypothetical protein